MMYVNKLEWVLHKNIHESVLWDRWWMQILQENVNAKMPYKSVWEIKFQYLKNLIL